MDQTLRRCCSDFGVPFSLIQAKDAVSMNLSETKDDIILTVHLAGMNPDDIDISLSEIEVIVRGEKKESAVSEGETYSRFEKRSDSFFRRIPLPRPVEVEATTATFKEHILTLTMPKKDISQQKSVSIRVKVE